MNKDFSLGYFANIIYLVKPLKQNKPDLVSVFGFGFLLEGTNCSKILTISVTILQPVRKPLLKSMGLPNFWEIPGTCR